MPAAALSVALLLAGCATSGTAEPLLTLADSKAAAQLLRNDALIRLPNVMVKEVTDITDTSVECGDKSKDPTGLNRAWVAGATLMITNSQAARIDIVTQKLVTSYVDEGWEATIRADSSTQLTLASRPTMVVTPQDKAAGVPPLIRVETTGVCVVTGGPTSAEVIELEKAH